MDKTAAKIKIFIAKGDEILRHLNILDSLAYESLLAQLKFIENAIRNSKNHARNIQLKWIASKKYLWFDDVKRSLLRSNGFIDKDMFEISNKNEIYDIIRRCNMTLFFNLLFSNFDPSVPDLPNVQQSFFFDYIVPSNMSHSEEIWDLDLNLRVQIYIYKMYKNPHKNTFNTMFPEETEGPPMYEKTYRKTRNRIKCYPEDVEGLMKEFPWENFTNKMYKLLNNIASDLEKPLLYKYTSIGTTSPVLSSSTSPDADDATQTNVDNNTDDEDQDMLLNSLTDSFSQSEEIVEQMMSHVNINENNQNNEPVMDELGDTSSDGNGSCNSVLG
jgi:hypothetical protein